MSRTRTAGPNTWRPRAPGQLCIPRGDPLISIFGVKAVRLQPECLPKRHMKQAERESEAFGFGNCAINVWVRDADCELFRCLTGADRTIDRPRAPDRA